MDLLIVTAARAAASSDVSDAMAFIAYLILMKLLRPAGQTTWALESDDPPLEVVAYSCEASTVSLA